MRIARIIQNVNRKFQPKDSTMILNRSQAEAVYSAMCALNNVSGTINEVDVGSAKVHASSAGIEVSQDRTGPMEFYLTQTAFATAYGLQ
jgi:hypothetical protein